MAPEIDGGPDTGAKSKLLIVGIDSSTFRVLKPLVHEGRLPTFRRLLEEGAHGILLSTIPPVTPPGWVTSYTGVNPGKHGIFDFRDHTSYLGDGMPYQAASVSSRSIKAEPFWDILNGSGMTVGLVNLPMVYPVSPMKGHIVSGFPCGTDVEGLYYPPEIAEEITREVGSYTFYLDQEDLKRGRPRRYLMRVNAVTQTQASTALHLARSRPTDVVMVVFTEVDRVQHSFWSSMDTEHPQHDAQRAVFKDAIAEHYELIDRNVGDLLKEMGPDTTVIVYSDHGSNSRVRDLYLNRHLLDRGIIRLASPFAQKGDGGVRAPPNILWLEGVLERLGLGHVLDLVPSRVLRSIPQAGMGAVDWSRTKAYFSSPSGLSVTINVAGREPEGWVRPGEQYEVVRDEVIAVLEDLRDPKTGKSPFKAIHRREDLYDGPSVASAPDIVLQPAEGYMLIKDFSRHVFADVGHRWQDRSSEHEREGVLIMMGPGIRNGCELEDRNIADIAPTVLHVMGVAVPRYMDGSVIEEAFQEDWMRVNPVQLAGTDAFEERHRPGTPMSKDDEDLLKDRLRSLGYMD